MLIFGLQQLLPGDPALVMAGEERDPEVLAQIRAASTASIEPLPVQYVYWVSGVLHGDFGESLRIKVPVLELIVQKLPVTLQLAAMAIVIALADRHAGRHRLGGARRTPPGTTAANVFALWGISTPNFWLGIMMIFLFSVELGWLPASGYVQPVRGSGGQPRRHHHAGLRARQRDRRGADAPHPQRHAAGAERDYVRTARAKGLAERAVVLQARAAQRADAGRSRSARSNSARCCRARC